MSTNPIVRKPGKTSTATIVTLTEGDDARLPLQDVLGVARDGHDLYLTTQTLYDINAQLSASAKNANMVFEDPLALNHFLSTGQVKPSTEEELAAMAKDIEDEARTAIDRERRRRMLSMGLTGGF